MMNTRILLISPRANIIIGQSSPVRVLGVFKDACNLTNDEEDVVSLVTGSIGPGPFSAVVDQPKDQGQALFDLRDQITCGQEVFVSANSWKVGNLHVNTNGGRVWNPQLKRRAIAESKLHPLVETMTSQILMNAPRDSLVSPIFREEYYCFHHERSATAWRILREALLVDDEAECAKASASLAGLGPGLTPAGDDFLIGVIYGMWLKSNLFSSRRIEEMAKASCGRTNSISQAWLNAASRGEAYHAWHKLVNAIYQGSSIEIFGAINQILEIGHTSGADALAGFLAYLTI